MLADYKRDAAQGRHVHAFTEDISRKIGSIINAMVFGYRFTDDHAHEFKELEHQVDETFRHLMNPLLMVAMRKPLFFQKLPFFKQALDAVQQCERKLHQFFLDHIEAHARELDLDSDSPARDYVEAFLRERARRQRSGQEKTEEEESFSLEQLACMCHDLWVAGQETTSTTINWAIAHLINRPEVQQRCHRELDQVIGSDRVITLADRPALPFLNATINVSKGLGVFF